MAIETMEECRLTSEKRWSKMEVELQKIKDDIKTMTVRLDKQETMVGDIQQISLNVASLSQNMQQMLNEIKTQNERLDNLEQKPVKRLNGAIDTIIKLVVTAGVTFLLIKLGLQ